MATFDQMYQKMLTQQNPMINVQNIAGDMPNWLRAPQPVNPLHGVDLLTGQMNQIGQADRARQQIGIQQQRADQERERARALADVQMRTFQAEQANLAQKRQAREGFAAENPEYASLINAGYGKEAAKAMTTPEKLSTAMRTYQEAGGAETGMSFLEFLQSPAAPSGPTINVGTASPPYKIPANYMLIDPADHSKGVTPIPGGPGEKRAGGDAGKEAMLDVAITGIPRIKGVVFEGGDTSGDINRDALFGKAAVQAGVPGALVPGSGPGLAGDLERGIQAITRIETGAAMPPSELENTRKRFEPGAMDGDFTIRQKILAYELFLKNAKDYLSPTGEVDADKALEDAAKQLKSDDSGYPSGWRPK